ncbi:MAG: CPBP family intramembrane metalloprotease [Clostridia bacterium]|nr:CPBP family intramembrane metalloprotease [Clostridia bacterium]
MNRNRIPLLLLLSAAVLLILEIVRPAYTSDPLRNELISTILTRTVGGTLFLLLISGNSGQLPEIRCACICLLPASAAAINNFPILGLLTGAVQLHASAADLLLLAAQSLAVGFFEETAFRGFLFPIVLRKFRNRNIFLPTILASAVFAAVHLVNLFDGISPAAVLLQVGYSFLIGGMCAVVLLKTHCLPFCVLLHAVYNFGGTLVPTFGSGTVWDPATITVTAVLGVIVLLYFLRLLSRITEDEISALLPKT